MTAACGGSGESDAAPGATSPTPSPPPAPPPPPAPAPSTPGTPTSVTSTSARLTTLTLYAAQSGALPYTAAVYPLEGSVPGGSFIASPDDPSLASSVLSRWPDGSAAVVVVAGEASLASGTAKTIVLATTTSNATALTPARVAALVKNVTVNAGALGVASVSSFASPERTWWANARVICCRYRAAIDSTLEAVIDIHAFASDRAFVEVVRRERQDRRERGDPGATGDEDLRGRDGHREWPGSGDGRLAGFRPVVRERLRRRPVRRRPRSVSCLALLDVDRRRPEGRGDARHRFAAGASALLPLLEGRERRLSQPLSG